MSSIIGNEIYVDLSWEYLANIVTVHLRAEKIMKCEVRYL